MSAVWVCLALAAFAIPHSLLASHTAKRRARRWLGQRRADGVYRLFYNVVAGLSLLPALALAAVLPSPTLWHWPTPLRFITIPVQAAASLALFISVWQVDLARFIGVRQIGRLLSGEAEPRDPPSLRTDGVYSWVRHPLYFFSLVVLWLMPVMTLNLLAFNLGATLYFWIGSIYEERKLVSEFGEGYRAYQARVPRLFPWPRHGR